MVASRGSVDSVCVILNIRYDESKLSSKPKSGQIAEVKDCTHVSTFTAGSKTIDQNRPIHTYALSFSPGMQPNNGAHYTLFAMLT